MKKNIAFVIALLVALAVTVASLISKKQDDAAFQFGEFEIFHDGELSIKGQSEHCLLVPRDKFPADLMGIDIIDLDEKVYVARFWEPGGIGVKGFYDVCFQLKNGKAFISQIEDAGSLERDPVDGSTYIKNCSYVFDSGKLLKIDSAEIKPIEVKFVRPAPGISEIFGK
jgi:hypothetical protein